MQVVPILTTPAGLCLTKRNWQETGSGAFSYHLNILLQKPGYTLLTQITDLAQYLACPGELILNASMFHLNKSNVFCLVSPLDGSKLQLDYPELIALILKLRPHSVILPPHCLKDFPEHNTNWPKEIKRFYSYKEVDTLLQIENCGVYFDSLEVDELLINRFKNLGYSDLYVLGEVNLEKATNLKNLAITYIETDNPSKDAFEGFVYNSQGILDLNNEDEKLSFTKLDELCACSVCDFQLTQSYFHHLYVHTPLLAQRMLIQHNVSYIQQFIRK